MDNTDVLILNALSENARVSASVLSEKVNLSVSAVIERIKKLENSGVIRQYTTVLDEQKRAEAIILTLLRGSIITVAKRIARNEEQEKVA